MKFRVAKAAKEAVVPPKSSSHQSGRRTELSVAGFGPFRIQNWRTLPAIQFLMARPIVLHRKSTSRSFSKLFLTRTRLALISILTLQCLSPLLLERSASRQDVRVCLRISSAAASSRLRLCWISTSSWTRIDTRTRCRPFIPDRNLYSEQVTSSGQMIDGGHPGRLFYSSPGDISGFVYLNDAVGAFCKEFVRSALCRRDPGPSLA